MDSKKGLYVASDDLNVGEYYAIVGGKGHDNPIPIAGFAFKVTAINMPFLVGRYVVEPTAPPITLDLRLFHLMRVDDAFVQAQCPQMPKNMAMLPQALLDALQGKP